MVLCCGNAIYLFDTTTSTLTISGTGSIDYSPWDNYYETIKTVIIQDGITSIGEWIFCGCTSLKSINIPESITFIGYSAFGYYYDKKTLSYKKK